MSGNDYEPYNWSDIQFLKKSLKKNKIKMKTLDLNGASTVEKITPEMFATLAPIIAKNTILETLTISSSI